MKRIIGDFFLFLIIAASATPGVAGPLEIVPEPLRPWVSWVLHDVEEYGCPPQYNNADDKRCVREGRLELQIHGVSNKGGDIDGRQEVGRMRQPYRH